MSCSGESSDIFGGYNDVAKEFQKAVQRVQPQDDSIEDHSQDRLKTAAAQIDQAIAEFAEVPSKEMRGAWPPSEMPSIRSDEKYAVAQNSGAQPAGESKTPKSDSGFHVWIYYVIAGAAVLVVVAAIVLFLAMKRTKKQKVPDILPVSSKKEIIPSSTTYTFQTIGPSASQDVLGLNNCEYPETPNSYDRPPHLDSASYVPGVLPAFYNNYSRNNQYARKRPTRKSTRRENLRGENFYDLDGEQLSWQPPSSSSNEPASHPPKIDFRKTKPDRIKATIMPIVPHGMPSTPTTPTATNNVASQLTDVQAAPQLPTPLPLTAADAEVEGAENNSGAADSAPPQHTHGLDGSPKDLFTETYLDMFGAVVAEDAPSPVRVRQGVHHPDIVVQGVLVSQAFFKNPPNSSEAAE